MKKKLLALLLAALMIVSILPVTAFSEGEVVQENQVGEVVNEIVVQQDPVIAAANALLASGDLGDPAPTTPDDVHDALDTAIGSEMDAAGEYPPLSPNQLEEVIAAGNDAGADQHLDNAEGVTGFSDGVTDFLADRAEEHADNAEQDAQDATNAADAAEAAADDADAALQDAENANNKAEAEAAADAAQDASVAAQKAAADALAAAQDAAQEAERAQNDYLVAQAAYEAAKAEVEEQLALGLIDAQTAEILTADAAARADAAYNTMVAAQTAAEQAVTDAKAAADAADAELQEKIDALEEAITTNAANVAEKTGVTVLTGAALAAAKLAAEATKLQVDYYEGQIESRQAEIDELEQKIADANKAIEDAEKAVEDAEKALAEAEEDPDYQQKLQELEDAKAALETAKGTVATLQGIVDALSEDEGVQSAESLMDAVKDGSATADDKKALTEYVFGNLSLYGEEGSENQTVTWVTLPEGDDRQIFELDGKYYQVVTAGEEGSEFLQFEEVKQSELVTASASDVPDNDSWASLDDDSSINVNIPLIGSIQYGTRFTGLQAADGTNEFADDTYPIVLKKSYTVKSLKLSYAYTLQVKDGSNYYDLKSDGDGYYFTKDGQRHNVTLCKPGDLHYSDPYSAFGTSSKTLEEAWAAAEANLQAAKDAQDALETAESNASTALELAAAAAGVTAAKEALEAAKETLAFLQENTDTSADEARIAQLQGEIKELDKKLNGNIAEQLARVFLDEGVSGVAEVLANAEVPVEALSEEDQARYAELEERIADLQEQYDNASGLARISIGAQLLAAQTERAGLAVKAGAAVTQDALEQGQALAELLTTLADGELNLDDASAVVNLLTGSGLSAKTKEFVMSKIVDILEGVHEKAVENLKEAVEKGIEEVAAAGEDAAEAALSAGSAHAALEIAKAAKTLADALVEDAADKKAAADQAAADAAAAAALYQALLESYGPSDENVQRAREAAEAADSYAAIADAEARRAQAAADKAQADYEKAREIADNFPVPAPAFDLGASIARYAWSLKGDGYAKLVNDPAKLNGKDFVNHVYSHFGIFLNYDGSVSDIGGYQVNSANRAPGDVVAVTGADGSVTGFGVNFGLDGIDGVVQFDEASGEVVMTAPAELGSFAAVRVV